MSEDTEKVVIELNRGTTTAGYRAGDTLLQTARIAGLQAPYSCETGSCGTCMARVVEGTARVVKSVAEIGRIQQGDILVCQVTNPTWSPIFQKIGAAVSDIGGSMSHMAIVAREYGLPAVVGTGKATQRIKDGQRIRVDGGRGVVTILDDLGLDEQKVLEDA